MNERVFIDTNILIYLYSDDETEKQKKSQVLFDKYDCFISTQVLNEFCNVCIGKLNQSTEDVELAIDEIIERCTISLLEKNNIKQAIQIHKRYGYKYFDSLIIVSALNSDCKYLLTEDLSDGQIIDGKLKIINIYTKDESEPF
jgi:predicted nucleic acid-binding protein